VLVAFTVELTTRATRDVDPWQEHLATRQDVRPADRCARAQAAPHDLWHAVAMEVLDQHHDLEQVRALLGHRRIATTQTYATIRPAQLKRAVAFYEDKAARMLSD
jgi:site-specific recombinase XerD